MYLFLLIKRKYRRRQKKKRSISEIGKYEMQSYSKNQSKNTNNLKKCKKLIYQLNMEMFKIR